MKTSIKKEKQEITLLYIRDLMKENNISYNELDNKPLRETLKKLDNDKSSFMEETKEEDRIHHCYSLYSSESLFYRRKNNEKKYKRMLEYNYDEELNIEENIQSKIKKEEDVKLAKVESECLKIKNEENKESNKIKGLSTITKEDIVRLQNVI